MGWIMSLHHLNTMRTFLLTRALLCALLLLPTLRASDPLLLLDLLLVAFLLFLVMNMTLRTRSVFVIICRPMP
jgi:hypothetical protein